MKAVCSKDCSVSVTTVMLLVYNQALAVIINF